MLTKYVVPLLAIAVVAAMDYSVVGEEKPAGAELDAPLPDGWPEPDDPGQIAVKKYPAYRSAIAKSEMEMDRADNVLFWQLFAHIQANEIAMTAPVVNTYYQQGEKQKVEMEFLYRTTQQGETGGGLGQVKVEDHPQQTFVTLVVQGKMDSKVYQKSLKQLVSWLKEKPQWKQEGDPRRLGYHGPMIPEAKRLWEVQIPVKATEKKEAAK